MSQAVRRGGLRLWTMPVAMSASSALQLVLLLTITLSSMRTSSALDFKYHNHNMMRRFLAQLSLSHPNITRLISLGKSYQGRDLLVLIIGKHAKTFTPSIPNVKYIGNMHGNEAVGREMLLHLAQHFVVQYDTNQTIKTFLDKTTVHLMPTMNPDGFSNSFMNDCMSIKGRGNAYGYDLNRNFPDPYKTVNDTIQRETKLVQNWSEKVDFVLSANLHGGAEVVNYPWDSLMGDMRRVQYAATPDDDVFRHLALTYSRSHATMHQGVSCGDQFKDGITNGANWYPVLGGMQDYMYRQGRGYQLLIEMSCCKYPDPSTLPDFWKKNKDALINLLFAVHIGVKGVVYSTDPNLISKRMAIVSGATIAVEGREEIPTYTSKRGEFYRLLLPGNYILKISKEGFINRTVPFTVYGHNNVTQLRIKLVQILISTEPTSQQTNTTSQSNLSANVIDTNSNQTNATGTQTTSLNNNANGNVNKYPTKLSTANADTGTTAPTTRPTSATTTTTKTAKTTASSAIKITKSTILTIPTSTETTSDDVKKDNNMPEDEVIRFHKTTTRAGDSASVTKVTKSNTTAATTTTAAKNDAGKIIVAPINDLISTTILNITVVVARPSTGSFTRKPYASSTDKPSKEDAAPAKDSNMNKDKTPNINELINNKNDNGNKNPNVGVLKPISSSTSTDFTSHTTEPPKNVDNESHPQPKPRPNNNNNVSNNNNFNNNNNGKSNTTNSIANNQNGDGRLEIFNGIIGNRKTTKSTQKPATSSTIKNAFLHNRAPGNFPGKPIPDINHTNVFTHDNDNNMAQNSSTAVTPHNNMAKKSSTVITHHNENGNTTRSQSEYALGRGSSDGDGNKASGNFSQSISNLVYTFLLLFSAALLSD